MKCLRFSVAVLFLAVIWLAIPQSAHAYNQVFDNISSDTTWYSGEVYVVYGSRTINTGATLTIEPGAVVKFYYGASLVVNGVLSANGTENNNVYFTSFLDDSVGGDTNGDGSLASPAVGDWAQITVIAGGNINLNHSVVRFGGVWPQYTNIFQSGGTLNVQDSVIESSPFGIRITGGDTKIENNIIRNNQNGIEVTGSGSLALNNNTFTNNVAEAVYISFNDVRSFASFGNTAFGNGKNGISMSGHLSSDQIWTDQIPYIIYNFTVSAGKTLTINPGAKIKFNLEGSMTVAGELNVNGVSDNKIYFTSIKDDSVGGDTNNDGFSVGRKADWGQITIDSGAVVNLNHSVVRFGGRAWPLYSNISLGGGTLLMSNSEISSSGSSGLRIGSGWANITNSTITDNSYGISVEGVGGVAISNSSVYNNSEYGIYNGTFTEINAENNWWGDAAGPYYSIFHQDGPRDRVSSWVDYDPWLAAPPGSVATTKEPVLIIPGIGGSELYNGDDLIWADLLQMAGDNNDEFLTENLMLDQNGQSVNHIIASRVIEQLPDVPIIDIGAFNVDTFKSLREDLERDSYIVDKDLFYFPYDWRLDLNNTAESLSTRIAEIKLQTGSNKVNIVAHSMGGLLAKEYVRQKGEGSVNKLIFVGTPHLGAPKAGKAIIEGDRFGIPWLEEDRIKEIAENSIALHELLPNQNYFNISEESYIKKILPFGLYDLLDYVETKEFLIAQGSSVNVFNSAEEFFGHNHESIDMPGIDVYNIAGCGLATQAGYEVNSEGAIKNIKYRKGDKTVPLISGNPITMQSISAEKRFFTTDGTHAELPSRVGVRSLVADILGGEPTGSYNKLSSDISVCKIKGKELIWRSPVDVHIYDSYGHHVGPLENGGIEYGIPEIDYEIVGHEKFVFIPTNTEEVYTVIAHGTDIGTFDLEVRDNDDGIITDEKIFNDVPVNTITIVKFDISDGPVNIIEVDRDSDGDFDIGFKPDGSWVTYSASIQSTLADLDRAYALGWTNGEVKNSLKRLLEAMLPTETASKSRGKQADAVLGTAFLKQLETEYTRGSVNKQAYDILKEDIGWLLR